MERIEQGLETCSLPEAELAERREKVIRELSSKFDVYPPGPPSGFSVAYAASTS